MRQFICLAISCLLYHVAFTQASTFKVSRKKDTSTSYIQLPQYENGKENILWLDSIPEPGTAVWLWSEKIIPTRFHFASPGLIAHPGNCKQLDANAIGILQWAKKPEAKLCLIVTEVFVNDKVYPAYWPYLIRFR
ncbi:MAG: hypothetical protein JNK66_10100 [Chitinophagales bacterium]|nr:hypothetical protein [Chitinophagales bacterium]